MLSPNFDVDIAMARIGAKFDELNSIFENNETYADRISALAQFETGFRDMEVETHNPLNVLLLVAGGLKSRGEISGDILITRTFPATRQIYSADVEAETRTRLAECVLRLELFKQESGKYPETLDDLKLIDEQAAADPFSGGQFVYATTDSCYRLYSVGRNETDDDGTGIDDGWQHGDSDIGVLMRADAETPE